MAQMTGKTAVVTGAASGLGSSFAHALAGAGATVICVDIDAVGNEATRDAIVSNGGKAFPLTADVSDSDAVEKMVAETFALVDRVDILVNNAGIATAAVRTHELALTDWRRLLSLNLDGVFFCCRSFLPSMLHQKAGSIVNISSILGMRGHYPGISCVASNYSAAKAGIIGLTKQIAAEYAAEGIRANVIAPGWHEGTNLGRERRKSSDPDALARFDQSIFERTPMRRRGRVDELNSLLLYLAGDESGFVTGQVIAHDGGWTAA